MNETRLTNTFVELTKISSPSGYEEEVRTYVIGQLKKIGLKHEVDKTGNIYSFIEGRGEPVLLCAHLDTVDPSKNVQPKLKGKWFESDGTTVLGADNKAAIAAILEAITSTTSKERRSVELIFTVREETDGGINFIDLQKIKSKVGIVADSELPLGSIVLSSPWNNDIEVLIEGTATHASTPELGINALKVTALALSKLKLGKFDRNTILNFGIITGGEAANTVPDKISMKGTLRSFDKKSFKKALESVEKTFVNCAKKFGAKATFISTPYCEGYNLNRKDSEVIRLSEMMSNLGFKVTYHSSFGGTDANYLFNSGIKVINIGDGAEDVHTVRERITTDSLRGLTKFFIEYISSS